MASTTHNVTQLLLDWNHGNKAVLDQLMPLVTEELRKLARHYMNQEKSGHTLQPTALVNELYMRLIDRRQVDWKNRAHFFAFAATTMRRILVDHARAQRSAKRGSGVTAIALEEVSGSELPKEVDLIALDEALKRLAKVDSRQSRMVELRFFAGLTLAETSEVMAISEATVSRDWALVKAWLHRELSR